MLFRRRRLQTLTRQWTTDPTPSTSMGLQSRGVHSGESSTELARTQARKAAIDALPCRIVPSPSSPSPSSPASSAPPEVDATADTGGAATEGRGSNDGGGAPADSTAVAAVAPAECVECAICLCEPAAGETVTTLPCGHEFHARCIKKWLDSSLEGVCPLCKRAALPGLGPTSPAPPAPPSRQQNPLPAAAVLPDAGGSSTDSRAIERQIDYSA